MKKHFILFLTVLTVFAVIAFISCEKPLMVEEETTGDVDGNLTIRVYEVDKTRFEFFSSADSASSTRAAKPVTEAFNRLNFAVYTLDGERVKQINQTVDMDKFGTASFQLEPGDYFVVILGHSSGGNPTMTDPTCIKFTNAQGYTDTFLCCANVNIAEEDVEVEASLVRIVSLCRFVITDNFPADVATMRFYYTGGSAAFDATSGLGCVNSKQDVKYEVTADSREFDLYTFLHDTEGTIHLTVSALDAAGNELYCRDFNVPMEQDHITWISGAYFNGSGSSSFDISGITVNTDWAGETHITF